MSAQLRPQEVPQARLVLLGTGTVGSAFVSRYQALQQRQLALPSLHVVANSRIALACGDAPDAVLSQARNAQRSAGEPVHRQEVGRLSAGDIVVDATASEEVAADHAHWLGLGIHVVTANKLGNGTALSRARGIGDASASGNARYGDAATVGAGLPLLRSIRALVAGGDHVHAIEGVLSGSLAWLFDRFDGSTPFSACVREAAAAGYTEPDPRIDLSGEDVRRKLLILARAAGVALEADQVKVESLVPAQLAALPADKVDAALELLDAPLQEQLRVAREQGLKLCFVGRLDAHGASVGLRALPANHPLAGGSGTDNRVAIHSDRYNAQPLLIQGPGAGAEVTAAALLDDVLGIVRS
ncbi:homoserine dehydrogenase [Stenotrophomonas sp. SY1]|uniref:homoserine dehydrogenase n=1 Tax=Stenotrophomonas sp. SY1 TaxID=477235 RepID=UPI001E538DBE|nr:homoserine dehydrogenase [Stenotrophomonas sp. SY1]MCD9086301.1 homoserine dehydrogenase [Stenotrophomonas sp. SY1]